MKNDTPIVHIITTLDLGGAQKVCLTLWQGMHSTATPTYLIAGTEGALAKTVRTLPNTFLIESFTRALGIKKCVSDMRSLVTMIRILKSLKKKHPNIIVHTHSSKAGVLGRWAAFFAGIKKRVHTVHNFTFSGRHNAFLSLAALSVEWVTALITTHFVCVSQPLARAGRFLPGFTKKSSIIRAAVDADTFIAAQRAPTPHEQRTPFIFGTISCLRPLKNVAELIRAFALVHTKNSNTRLEIIGDGTLRQELESCAQQLGVHHAVVFHGWQHTVAPLMKTWHCFVFTSLWEGLPCSFIEARLLKLPVLTYDTGGAREVIHHGINGMVYPQRAWKALAEGMLAISTDELMHITLAHYRDNLTEFSHPIMLKKHAELYKRL